MSFINRTLSDDALVNDINIHSLPSCLGSESFSGKGSAQDDHMDMLQNYWQKKVRERRRVKVRHKIYKAGNLFKKRLQPFLESKYVRFLDQAIDLGEIKKSSVINVGNQANSMNRPFLQLVKFKRIQRYEYNISSETWKYLLEDRVVKDEVRCVPCNTNNLYNSFMRFDDYNNKEFCQLLMEVDCVFCLMNCKINNLPVQSKMIQKPMVGTEFQLCDLELASKEDLEIKGRVYYTKLCQQTKRYIKSQPHFIFLREISSESKGVEMTSFSHNKKIKNLIGLDCITQSEMLEGFEILSYILSDDWQSLYSKILSFIINYNQTTITLEHNEAYIMSKKFGPLSGNFILYKQIYEELPNNFMIELHFVYVTNQDTMEI